MTITTTGRLADPLTIAFIAAGVGELRANGYVHPDGVDQFELMELTIAHAPAIDAEWQRRYGTTGIAPGQCRFDTYVSVAKAFGWGYPHLLAVQVDARPDVLIRMLFDAADPEFDEPGIDSRLKSIRLALFGAAAAIDPDQRLDARAMDILTDLDRKTEGELIQLYRAVFGMNPPASSLPPSAPDEGTSKVA